MTEGNKAVHYLLWSMIMCLVGIFYIDCDLSLLALLCLILESIFGLISIYYLLIWGLNSLINS